MFLQSCLQGYWKEVEEALEEEEGPAFGGERLGKEGMERTSSLHDSDSASLSPWKREEREGSPHRNRKDEKRKKKCREC